MSVGEEITVFARLANGLRILSGKWWKYARGTFFPTGLDDRSFWASTKQPDGTVTTSLSIELQVRNRTAEELHLVKATLCKPRIGPTFQTLIVVHGVGVQAPIAAHATMSVMVHIVVVGAPREDGPLEAVVRISDSDGYTRRVKVTLRDPQHPLWVSRKQRRP